MDSLLRQLPSPVHLLGPRTRCFHHPMVPSPPPPPPPPTNTGRHTQGNPIVMPACHIASGLSSFVTHTIHARSWRHHHPAVVSPPCISEGSARNPGASPVTRQ